MKKQAEKILKEAKAINKTTSGAPGALVSSSGGETTKCKID
ncbi:hypothetical protein [Lacihabitans soyangensis]|nr:hypothetical protein [Lacihabitans soyangensis]